jgi:hypothetical protein
VANTEVKNQQGVDPSSGKIVVTDLSFKDAKMIR